MLNYAKIDNNLSDAQASIGESSNLAQICLTYTYNAKDNEYKKKYEEYVCILSVLAQVAIDNAKRKFDIDLVKEIDLIKKDMDIKENQFPSFWSIVKKDFNKKRINKDLKCPMNYIFDIQVDKYKSKESTLPMSDFFVKFKIDENEKRRKSRKVEDLIQKYSLDLYTNYQKPKDCKCMDDEDEEDNYLLLRSDFDDLINDIRSIYISKNYLGLMSWLIDRAFLITSGSKRKASVAENTTNNNKAILLKTLYTVNKDAFLQCFSKKNVSIDENQH